jgi:N-acetylmuramoyl-L-alanine amidase
MVAAFVLAGPIGPAWAPRPASDASIPKVEPAEPPAPTGRVAIKASAAELKCLAMNVYWESRGQPEAGQAAVAHVTLNRSQAPAFPASICGVVHQSCQFGWTCDGRDHTPTDQAAWDDALRISKEALAGGHDPTGGALYFHHVEERPQFAKGRYDNRKTIGLHVFFNLREGSERQVAQVAADP